MKITELDFVSVPRVRTVWIVWAVASLLSVVVYFPTLTLTKHIWQDEVQILELGRGMFQDLDQSHSMAWRVDDQRPASSIAYLGRVVQEICYRVFAPSPVGPRMSSLVGAVLASAAVLGWLISRGTLAWVAVACSLLLLWDPLFVEGYRGARVDSWSMACMLFALWIIADGLKTNKGLRFKPNRWQAAAGLLIALAGLVWVSAVLLLPLVVLQCLQGSGNPQPGELRLRIAALVWIGVFALLFFALLLIPLAPTLAAQLSDLRENVGNKASQGIDVAAFLAPYVRSPWVPIFAIIGIVYARLWGFGLVLAAAVCAVLLTAAYVHRSIYLLPYFLAILAAFASAYIASARFSIGKQLLVVVVLLFMLLWSAGLSLGARTVVAWNQRDSRDPEMLHAMLRDQVGSTPRKAYLVPYELYYAARQIKWMPFKAYLREDWSDENMIKLLSEMEVVIQRADTPSPGLDDLLNKMGFTARILVAGTGSAKRPENYGKYIIYER